MVPETNSAPAMRPFPTRRNRDRKLRIRFIPHRKGARPWQVDGVWAEPGQDPARHRKFFRSEADAKEFKFRQGLDIRAGGLGAPSLSTEARLTYQRAIAVLQPYGRSITDAVNHYVAYLKSCEQSCLLSAVLDKLVARKTADGSSQAHLDKIRNICARFVATHPNRLVAQITTGDVDDWLARLRVSNSTKNNNRRYLMLLFSFAKNQGYCPTNPAQNVELRKVDVGDIAIFTPEQLRHIMDAADPAVIPVIAMRAFAGLREAETFRMDWSEITLDRGHIELKAGKSKTNARRIVPIQPNLAAWLRPHAKPFGRFAGMGLSKARKLYRLARRKAGIKGTGNNELRHSFCSYRLAHLKDKNAVALEMGNSPGVITSHYLELVDEKTAGLYWQIMPRAANRGKVVSFSA